LKGEKIMEISKNYASKGVAGAGLGTGIAGLALGVLNAAGGLGAAEMNAGHGCAGVCSENTPVSRYELNQAQVIAEKDAEIGLLKADKYTDQKIVDATAYLMGQINSVAAEVRKNKDEQNGVNMQQVAYNATNSAAIGCLQGQVAMLQSLTKCVIPNSSVCPGWGDVKVTIDTATTSATSSSN